MGRVRRRHRPRGGSWLKYYPGLTFVGLIALRRPRALVAFVAVAGAIGLVDFDGFRQSIRNGAVGQAAMADKVPRVHETKHSIVENWKSMKFVRRVHLLGQIPGPVAAAALLVPAIVGVSRGISRAADPRPLIFPYLLWLTAAATFGMPYANDYNLVPLVLAVLAAWDLGDRWPVHALLGPSMAWLQPFWLPLGGQNPDGPQAGDTLRGRPLPGGPIEGPDRRESQVAVSGRVGGPGPRPGGVRRGSERGDLDLRAVVHGGLVGADADHGPVRRGLGVGQGRAFAPDRARARRGRGAGASRRAPRPG